MQGEGKSLSRVSDRESPPRQPYYLHSSPVLSSFAFLFFLTSTQYYFFTSLLGLSNPTLRSDKRETLAIPFAPSQTLYRTYFGHSLRKDEFSSQERPETWEE